MKVESRAYLKIRVNLWFSCKKWWERGKEVTRKGARRMFWSYAETLSSRGSTDRKQVRGS